MKIPKFFKKAAAFVVAAVTALSIMPATAFAAGDIGMISFSHTYDSNGNAMRYNSSANIGGYTAGGTGNYKYRMFVDGENAFCIQPGVPLKTGNTLKKASSDTWNALSANQKKAVGLALLYGYQGNRNNLSGSDDEKWLATQTLVWEFVTGCREATGSYNQTSTTVYSLHFGSNYANSGARAVYDQIVAMLREHNTIPSFMSGGKNDITKELAYKDGKYSITLNDSNGVLSDYSFSSSDSNVSVSKSGNKLTISSTVAISGSIRITAKRNNVPTVSSSAKLIAYGDPNLQDLVAGVENADTVSAYINIETPTGTIALKKTSEDGVVEGISFTIKGDNFNKTVKTGKDGSVSVEGLFPGTYTVTEQSIDRYEPQKTQTVTLIGGKTSTVTFGNTLKRGSLEIVKTSEDNLVEGMKFHLYGTSLSGLPVDEYAVTDKNGLAKFENVLISGDTPYVVEEVDTAVRYVVPASQTAPIEWNKVTKRSFDNVLKKFQVTVTKTDAETGSPQGNASLAGAVYGIYKGEELIDTYTTDENGQFTTKYYICDNDWTVREISPSEGYLLDTAIHKVGAEPELYTVELNSTANDVNEQVIKGNIALIKHTDNGETQIETPEEGAVFEVFLKSAGSYENAKETERDVLTCDENGFAQTKDMPYGIYTVRQTSGWEGRELMKDFDVFISKDGQTYRYLINNANFESYIKIVKKDVETGNTIPYAGAGFQIYDPNGNLVTMTFTYPEVTTIDTFYTTADGDLITPQTLEYGKGYSLVEVQAPYGYVLNSEPVYFDVVQENSEEESGITVIEVVRSNMAQKGTITVEKSGEVFSSVAGDKGLYQPIFSVSGLEGAVYEITAAEDIVTLDGTVRANKGEVVDTVTTGKDGTVKSKELYLGKYEVKEITAPYGMVLNEEVRSVELVYAGQNVDVTETATSFYNERQRVEIDLIKSLAIDEAYGIGKNGEIFDVTFGLYAAEELTAADGKTIPADGLIEVISLDESGHGKAISDLPMGSYYVQEISTNSAYIVSDAKYPVIFEYAGQDTETVCITANEGEAITNDIIYGSVSGKKSDEDGKALGGAVIGIFTTGTTEFTKENAIAATTSKDDGSFSFAKVPYGTWIIREIESPKGYVLSEEEIAVTIGKVDEVVEIELVNYFIKGNIALTNAGTEVTSDILILQKRDRVMDIEPDWVHLDTDENGVTMNRYFVEHPEMVLGEIKMENTRFGTFEPVCKARKDIPLSELLSNAVQRINGEIPELDNRVDEISDEQELSVPADPNVRNFSFTLVDGRVYFRENDRMQPASVSMTAENRIKGLIQIRDCVRKLIEYQTDDYPEEMIRTEQENLNRLYDVYTAKYGLINSRGNYLAFASDESYFLLCSLEVLDDEGNFKRKADMFTKRTIKPHREVTSVETASEALALSIGEKARVDLPYMEQLTGKTQAELVQNLQGIIFKVPNCEPVSYVAADEYLSGNVRNKLTVAELAAKNDPELAVNVEALEKVIPKDLSAAEISVRLGATWIPQEDIQRFVMELLTPSSYAAGRLKVRYTPINGDWFIENKSSDIWEAKTKMEKYR